MNPNSVPETPTESAIYFTIRVKGLLNSPGWAEWFGRMTLELDEAKAETRLHGPIADQAELYGLLARLRNLGLALLSVEGG